MKEIQSTMPVERTEDVAMVEGLDAVLSASPLDEKKPLQLVLQLCQELDQANIAYCHWKSNNALDRSASGENDLDLLVSRSDVSKFAAILFRSGFKQAKPESQKELIGVLDFHGYDEPSGRLVHVHTHYQLVMGHDMTKNFRLPIENAYLNSAIQDGIFKVPAPEFEFIVLVVRLILKHSTWDVILGKEGKIRTSEQRELEFLQARLDRNRVDDILKEHLPYISTDLFNRCLKALQPGCSSLFRARTGQQLQRSLLACSRHSLAYDVIEKQRRKWIGLIRKRIFKLRSRRRLLSGGAMIAIIGGDGAGKTTTVKNLSAWLSRDFDLQTVHMGKPRESLTTIIVRAILRLGSLIGLYPHLNSMSFFVPDSRSYLFPGKIPWMMREACKARDRYKTYLKARQFVNNGGIVISDRFPLPEIALMDAPLIEKIADGHTDFLSRFLIKFERRYYQRITPPELVIILRLNPDEAVRRKVEEDPAQVHARSSEIWNMKWTGSFFQTIDTQRPREEVLSSIKSLVWSKL